MDEIKDERRKKELVENWTGEGRTAVAISTHFRIDLTNSGFLGLNISQLTEFWGYCHCHDYVPKCSSSYV